MVVWFVRQRCPPAPVDPRGARSRARRHAHRARAQRRGAARGCARRASPTCARATGSSSSTWSRARCRSARSPAAWACRQQAASKAAGELERLGYLERSPDPADGRVRRVGLSAARARPRSGPAATARAALADGAGRRASGEDAAGGAARRRCSTCWTPWAARRPCARGACRAFASVSGCERNASPSPTSPIPAARGRGRRPRTTRSCTGATATSSTGGS